MQTRLLVLALIAAGAVQREEIPVANFDKAIEVILKREGGSYENSITGEVAQRGITLKLIQRLAKAGYETFGIEPTRESVLASTEDQARKIYERYFWQGAKLDKVFSDRVATKLLDMSVNVGVGPATKLTQLALRSLRCSCKVDGLVGKDTTRAINDCDPAYLIPAMRKTLATYYAELAERKPVLKNNLAGWLNRAADKDGLI